MLRESSPLCDGKGYRGRGSGTTATAVTDAANVDDDKATATTITDATSDDDNVVVSGGRRCPTTAMTIADAVRYFPSFEKARLTSYPKTKKNLLG